MLSTNDQQALLAWYDEHQRDLPWRRTNDPWAILLSETLLQQTQVSRGLVYWHRMVEAFPTVASMAEAPVDAVLKAWEGAGYHSRARRLHAPSQRGCFQRPRAGLMTITFDLRRTSSLPRIGPYTAAAVASIAFGQPVACVDGNIRRVMARQTAQPNPTPKQVQAWADASLHGGRAGDWNQALMELGANGVHAKTMDMRSLPDSDILCVGKQTWECIQHPRNNGCRPSLTALVEFVRDGHPVLQQRPMSGLFAGLLGPEYKGGFSEEGDGWRMCGTVRHKLSHRKLEVCVYLKQNGIATHGTARADVALSTLDEKVLDLAAQFTT